MVTPMPEPLTCWKNVDSDSPACAVKVCVPRPPVIVIELCWVKNEPVPPAMMLVDSAAERVAGELKDSTSAVVADRPTGLRAFEVDVAVTLFAAVPLLMFLQPCGLANTPVLLVMVSAC